MNDRSYVTRVLTFLCFCGSFLFSVQDDSRIEVAIRLKQKSSIGVVPIPIPIPGSGSSSTGSGSSWPSIPNPFPGVPPFPGLPSFPQLPIPLPVAGDSEDQWIGINGTNLTLNYDPFSQTEDNYAYIPFVVAGMIPYGGYTVTMSGDVAGDRLTLRKEGNSFTVGVTLNKIEQSDAGDFIDNQHAIFLTLDQRTRSETENFLLHAPSSSEGTHSFKGSILLTAKTNV